MLEILGIIVMLVFLEGILSIDNAAVLGAMVAHLPPDQPIVWPKALRFMEGHGERLLGPQQQAALKVGLLGAYIGRGIMLALAFIITKNEWVLLIGAAYLFYLGINHFAGVHRKEQEARDGVKRVNSMGFWQTVLVIELIDLAFSLDNVVAAVTLDPQRRFWLIAIGVGIGILAMRFAATIFTKLIQWEPNLEHAAFLLLIVIGGETVLKSTLDLEIPHWLKFVISLSVLLLTLAISRLRPLRPLKRVLRLGMPVAALISAAINLIFWPVRWLFGLLLMPFRAKVEARFNSGD